MDLGKQVISSLKWVTAAKFVGQIFTWAITIFVIRLLEPADYGLLALAVAVMGLIELVNEMGLGAAIIQKKNLDRAIIEKIYGLLLLVNSLLYALLFLTAPFIASFFDEPALTDILRVVGIQLLLSSFIVIPDGLLTRDMKFKYIATIGFFSALIASITTLILALLDFGVWALVWGNLSGFIFGGIALNIVVKNLYIPNFSLSGIRKVIGFGGLVTTDRMLWYLYSEFDVFIIGKFLGKDLLGIYAVAKQLASIPMVKISQVLTDIAFAAFSRIQDDLEKVSRHFLKSVRLMSFIAFPVFFGIASVATEIVDIFLGEKWELVAIPLQLLSLVLPLRMLQSIVPSALMGLGRPDINVKNQSIACVMMPLGIIVGLNWGLTGVCLAWVFVYPMYFVIMLFRSLPTLGVTFVEYLNSMRDALFCSALMFGAVVAMRVFLEMYSITIILQMIILVITGALVYLLATLLVQRQVIQEVRELVRP